MSPCSEDERTILAALDIEPSESKAELAGRIADVARVRRAQTRVAQELLLRLVPCIERGLVNSPLELFDDAEAAHSVLSGMVAPLSEKEWLIVSRDLGTDDLDNLLRLAIMDHIVPRLAKAGLIDLWPPGQV
jgi:hypothetical protein